MRQILKLEFKQAVHSSVKKLIPKYSYSAKKVRLGFRAFRTCFGKLTTPPGMFLKQKTQIVIAHQKEGIDRTQKSTASRQKKFPYAHWLNSAICLQKPFFMLHDQNYVFECLGGLLCYQIMWGKYQRLEKATQRPAKARLKSVTIPYIRCLWFTTI